MPPASAKPPAEVTSLPRAESQTSSTLSDPPERPQTPSWFDVSRLLEKISQAPCSVAQPDPVKEDPSPIKNQNARHEGGYYLEDCQDDQPPLAKDPDTKHNRVSHWVIQGQWPDEMKRGSEHLQTELLLPAKKQRVDYEISVKTSTPGVETTFRTSSPANSRVMKPRIVDRILTNSWGAIVNPDASPSLKQFMASFNPCVTSSRVVSSRLKEEIEKAQAENQNLLPLQFFHDRSYEPPVPSMLAPNMPLAKAYSFFTAAFEARVTNQNEAGWNMMVHYPILDYVLRELQVPSDPVKHAAWATSTKAFVGSAPCTGTPADSQYRMGDNSPCRVDFCIFVTPRDQSSREAIRKIRKYNYPHYSLNHTKWSELEGFIAISIESKKSESASAGKAHAQVGAWQRAQWNFLASMCQGSQGAESPYSLDGLPLLPSIIIKGDEWSLAVTTRLDDGDIRIWVDQQLGSTKSLLGVYSIAWGLTRLRKWVLEEFWPWYQGNALPGAVARFTTLWDQVDEAGDEADEAEDEAMEEIAEAGEEAAQII